MATKQISVGIDWLDAINGKSVAHAIAYLNALDPTLTLDAWLNGSDLHGVEMASDLTRGVEMTPKEIFEEREAYWKSRIKEVSDAKIRYHASYVVYGNQPPPERLQGYDNLMAMYEGKLEELAKDSKSHKHDFKNNLLLRLSERYRSKAW